MIAKLLILAPISIVTTLLMFAPEPRTSKTDSPPAIQLQGVVSVLDTPTIEKKTEVEAMPSPASTATCEQFVNELHKYDWDVNIMRAIAMGESGCRWATGDNHLTFEQNGRTYGYSIGFLQYRILPGREDCEFTTIQKYVECNYKLWQGGGYKHWTIYNKGIYRQFL